MKRVILLLVLVAVLCYLYFFPHHQTAPHVNNNHLQTASASSSLQNSTRPLSSSLFISFLEKRDHHLPSFFLPYPPAPLQELSEKEEADFPQARVVEFTESETSYFRVRERILILHVPLNIPTSKQKR
jgi:hypothetical protein